MTRTARSKTPARRLLDLLWQQPLWAVPFALFFGTLSGPGVGAYLLAYRLSLVFAYFIGLALWVTAHWVLPRIPQRSAGAGRSAFEISAVYAVMSLAGSYAAALVNHLFVMPGFLGGARAALISGMYTLLFVALFAGIRFAMAYHDLALERARAVEQARADLARAELRALRAQINPHFLFNTLNSIASLIAANPPAAEETTTRLAEIFRYALRASEREHAPLSDELEFLRTFLAIERTRFGDRLRLEEAIEPGLDSVPVPSLLLQPLVENAVRHAVAARPQGATVRLVARRDGERLIVEVSDDGPGFDPEALSAGEGFGLHSVRERLRAAGLADALVIESGPGRGTRVRVSLPIAGPAQSHPQPEGIRTWTRPNECS